MHLPNKSIVIYLCNEMHNATKVALLFALFMKCTLYILFTDSLKQKRLYCKTVTAKFIVLHWHIVMDWACRIAQCWLVLKWLNNSASKCLLAPFYGLKQPLSDVKKKDFNRRHEQNLILCLYQIVLLCFLCLVLYWCVCTCNSILIMLENV